jgi:hypothetical protein
VSSKLAKQIRVELEVLHRLLERHPELLEKCGHEVPTSLEIDALASMLHSFYTGIENIFKRIQVTMDEPTDDTGFGHAALLDIMAHPSEKRPAVISPELRTVLRNYLQFRHMFRHAYSFELKWSRMSHLVLDMRDALHRLARELTAFLDQISKTNE